MRRAPRAVRRPGRARLALAVRVAIATFAATLAVPAPVGAEPMTTAGLTFSDELGGFEILSVAGSGTPDDPIVVVERVTADGPVTLIVRGLVPVFGSRARTNHFTGFVMEKVVINATGRPWPGYRVELEEVRGQESSYHDGLSFAQDPRAARPFASDRFARIALTDEPRDGLAFGDGTVAPGEQVRLRFIVSDNTPDPEFFIVQKVDSPVAGLDGHAPGPNRLESVGPVACPDPVACL
jgi:hypothetical protein